MTPFVPDPPLPPRFTPRRRLGRGAAGEVWLAWDDVLGREVALKRITHDAPGPWRTRARREVEILSRIDHPNVVRCWARGESPGLWMALEPHATTLHALVHEEGCLSPQQAARLGADALRGLQHLHDHQVVHRDVKPSNILISHGGAGILADLGAARVVASVETADGHVLGTPLYMAPEQRESASTVDGRADLYGLGATLWFAAVGSRPPDLSMMSVAPSRRVADKLPPELRDIVLRATALEPSERFASAAAMRAALEEVASA